MSAVLFASGSPAIAASNKTNAPGQDRTCLVTTKNANSWNDTDVDYPLYKRTEIWRALGKAKELTRSKSANASP